MSTTTTDSFKKVINKNQYDYYFTITFQDYINVDEDHQIKDFIKHLHRKLFSQRYRKYNKFLNIILTRESHVSNNNDHFHGLISTSPHDISFPRLIKAFVYANRKLHITPPYNNDQIRTTTEIYNWNIPELTFNHHKNKYTVDPYDYAFYNYSPALLNILPRDKVDSILISTEDHSFPLNLIPIESPEAQNGIINYILKDNWKSTDHVAFLQPTSNDYFNFSTKPE